MRTFLRVGSLTLQFASFTPNIGPFMEFKGNTELPVTCDSVEHSDDPVRLTRGELDALIDEAVRKDRSRR